MKRQILALICIVALLITGGGNSVSVQAAKKAISLSKKNVTLKAGQSKQLKIKKVDKVKIKSKVFQSSNKTVATVTKKTGKIKAKKAGKATIAVKVKYIKKQKQQKKTVVLKCKVAVLGNQNNSDTTKTNETVIPNQSRPGSGVTERPMPAETNGNAANESKPTLPVVSYKPETSESPTEEPTPGNDGVIETETFDDFAQAAAQLVKDNKSSNGSGIAASDEFYTKRLIVKGKDADLSFEAYKPIAVVKSSDNIFMVQFETASAAKTAMGELSNLPNVEYVEADSYSGASVEGKNDSKKFNSWGVSKIGADQYAEKIASNVNQEVEIAVVDTGVSSHEFLDGRISDKGMDFVDVDIIPNDLNSHGTHVAGTIVDCTPNLNVKIVPVRVLDGDGSGYSSIVGMGIRYAVNCGVKVINLSLGGGHSQYIDDNINYAIKKGVTVVVAAGNEYGNTSDYCPSHLTNVIVVGAVDENDKKAGFSNTGSSLDVVAPGVDIVSCIPGGGYKSYDGTSMATPHIAAIAAMFALVYPEKQPSEIEEMIKGCTRDLGEKGWDKQYGHGIPDLSSSGIVPTELTLDKFNIMMKVGDTETLTATVLPNGVVDKSVLWSSSDSSIVSVQDGILEAKAAGNAVITAETVNGKSAACNVVVSGKDREAGLYDASTNEMIKSWEELIRDKAVVLSEDGKTVLSADNQALKGILVIEEGIEEIASGSGADDDSRGFKNCFSLVAIEIPDSVTTIGEKAFYEVPLVIYDGSAEGKPWGAEKVQNSYGTSKSIFKMGNKKLALGMSRTDLYTVLGGQLSHELRTGLAPQGFDTIAFNTKDYKEYLLVYLKDERVTGICGIGKEMSFNGAVAGKNSNTLGSNWKNLNDYKTSSGKVSSKKISLSGSEQAYAFYDVLGDNTIYCIQVFDPTKVKDQDHDMIYMTENLSYDATVCNSIATEIGHMLNAFRMYCNINTFSLHSGLAQCAQNYCNNATGSKLNGRGEPALINAIEAAGTDPSAWGEACYYDAGDAISFANSLIELDDFYLVLINTKEVDGWTPIWGYAGVGMAANGKHAYITIDYVDEV